MNEHMHVACSNLSFCFKNEVLFRDLSFEAESGSHTVLKGDSGSGKSTILKLILGFYLPDEGTISLNGNNESPQKMRKHTAWLPQDLDLGSGTTKEVILKPFEFEANTTSAITDELLVDTLEILGLLPDVLEKPFRNLSTGQRQRVGIAICYLLDKPILLLDEPTSALDRQSKERAANLLLAHTNKCIISTSHDPFWIERAENLIELE